MSLEDVKVGDVLVKSIGVRQERRVLAVVEDDGARFIVYTGVPGGASMGCARALWDYGWRKKERVLQVGDVPAGDGPIVALHHTEKDGWVAVSKDCAYVQCELPGGLYLDRDNHLTTWPPAPCPD